MTIDEVSHPGTSEIRGRKVCRLPTIRRGHHTALWSGGLIRPRIGDALGPESVERPSENLSACLSDSGVRCPEQNRNPGVVLGPCGDEFICSVRLLGQDPDEQAPGVLGTEFFEQSVGISIGGSDLICEFRQFAGGSFKAIG
jgi:hypothetical protein